MKPFILPSLGKSVRKFYINEMIRSQKIAKMDKLLLSMILLLLTCSIHAIAQSRINLEMYFVPQQHHQSLLNDPSPSYDFATRTGLNLGLGLSYNINSDWQMVLQSWHASSPFGLLGTLNISVLRIYRSHSELIGVLPTVISV